MNYLELGGCCLARHGTPASMFSSKAERIMARFRPIAPKPVAYSPSDPLQPPEPLPISAETTPPPLRHLHESSSRSKRTRKRRGDSDARAPKRPNSGKSDKRRCGFAPGAASDIARVPRDAGQDGHFDPFGVVVPQGRVSKGDMHIDATLNVSCESSDASDGRRPVCNIALATGCVDGGMVHTVSSGMIDSAKMFEKDVAFMERAAASAPPTVLPDRRIGVGGAPKCSHFGGNFTEMIRGIAGLTSPAEVRSLMHPNWTANVKGSMIDVAGGDASPGRTFPAISSMDSRADEVGDGAKLVTLHLLPETPSRVDSPEESSLSTCTSLSNRPSRFGWFSEDVGVASPRNYYMKPFLDQRYIEKVYSSSPDPVLLMDDSHQVLWFNKAYERAAKADLDRMAGKGVGMGPFIDPLGLPTPLGTFSLQSSGRSGGASATLWGFLKKFVVPDFQNARESSDAACLMPGSFVADREEAKKNGVITPQAKRLVGSTVSLESVTEVHLQATALSESMEEMEKVLEEGTLPAFMTDASNRVRWVNTAYKKMVGQPECPWLASTVMSNAGNGKVEGGMGTTSPSSSSRLTGEVLLVGTNDKIPELAAAFSGRVNIKWTNRGERSSMTVPCDVTRLFCGRSGGSMFVWKFDVGASLRLTCGS